MSSAGTTPAAETPDPLPSAAVAPQTPPDEREEDPHAQARLGRGGVMLTCIAVTQLAWIGALAYLAHRLLF